MQESSQLLPRHLRGDPGAFPELVRSFRAPVFGYILRCGVGRSAADDLFQDIFIRVHNAAATYEPSRPLKPWIFAIVVNVVRSYYRRDRVLKIVAAADTESDSPSAQAVVEAQETAALLEDALGMLTLPEREVVLLCSLEQLEQKDVAAMLGMPVNTVKTHLHRARATLAAALTRRDLRTKREVSR